MDADDERAPSAPPAASPAASERRTAEEWVDLTYRDIYAALMKLTGGNADLAADLTQETYRKAWSSLSSFAGRAQFSTWLYRIAYTTFLNHVRRPRLFVAIEDAPPAAEADRSSPPVDERLGQAAQAERLRRAVLGLPDDLRFTVTARYWRDLPVSEIAVLDGISTVAVRKRLQRAFRILGLALEEDQP